MTELERLDAAITHKEQVIEWTQEGHRIEMRSLLEDLRKLRAQRAEVEGKSDGKNLR